MQLRLGLATLRFELLRIHTGKHLPGGNEIPLIDQYFFDASRRFSRHVNLDRLDPAVATRYPFKRIASEEFLPSIIAAPGEDRDESGNKPRLCGFRNGHQLPFL